MSRDVVLFFVRCWKFYDFSPLIPYLDRIPYFILLADHIVLRIILIRCLLQFSIIDWVLSAIINKTNHTKKAFHCFRHAHLINFILEFERKFQRVMYMSRIRIYYTLLELSDFLQKYCKNAWYFPLFPQKLKLFYSKFQPLKICFCNFDRI